MVTLATKNISLLMNNKGGHFDVDEKEGLG